MRRFCGLAGGLIVTMPFGLAMFNRVGAVMTLLRY
jgi:hypothetical protein